MAIGIIGLPPDYRYPGDTRTWWSDTTTQAANLGAAFITRSLMRQLDAEFVPIDTPPETAAERYDHLVVALATHLHRRRDVSVFVDFLEATQLPASAFSLGVEDYIGESDVAGYRLDPTVHRLLSLVAERSGALGCRGPWSADVLHANGFDDVVPFGCPSVFWQLRPDVVVREVTDPQRPVCAFHRSLATTPDLLDVAPLLLGQDFQDHALMTDELDHDELLIEKNRAYLASVDGGEVVHRAARARGTWPGGFDEWMGAISAADFVYGPRLHGCISALAHGVPSLLLTRDLRTREMVHSVGLPNLPLEDARGRSLRELALAVDLDAFRERYRSAYARYLDLLAGFGLAHRLAPLTSADVSAT